MSSHYLLDGPRNSDIMSTYAFYLYASLYMFPPFIAYLFIKSTAVLPDLRKWWY